LVSTLHFFKPSLLHFNRIIDIELGARLSLLELLGVYVDVNGLCIDVEESLRLSETTRGLDLLAA
jgi:hypothetical protein